MNKAFRRADRMTADPDSLHAALAGDQVHVWTVATDRLCDIGGLAWCRNLLAPDECRRLNSFRFEKDRLEFLSAHALVRLVLSRYAPVAPEAWQFSTGEYGKPYVRSPGRFRDLQFNLSHTRGMAAFAVALRREVGLDVEWVDRQIELDIADRFFAPSEVLQLEALPPGQCSDRFFDFWTLKEAYIKARGMGLALPLHDFAFELAGDEPPRISFSPAIDDAPESWHFHQSRPTEEHRLALAVRTPSGAPPDVVFGEISLEPPTV